MTAKRSLIAASGAVAVLAVVLILTIVVAHKTEPPKPQPLIPTSVSKQLTITLYYPQPMPSGLSIQPRTFKVPEKNVLVFGITDGKQQIAVSEQAKPTSASFDINKFYTDNIQNSSQFLTSEGQVTQGQLSDGRRIASLVTASGTWIIVTAPAKVSAEDVHNLVAALRVFKK